MESKFTVNDVFLSNSILYRIHSIEQFVIHFYNLDSGENRLFIQGSPGYEQALNLGKNTKLARVLYGK